MASRVISVQVPKITEIPTSVNEHASKGEITQEQLADYKQFLQDVNKRVMTHPVILDNKYTQWFAFGDLTVADIRHMVQQFSVFSHLFLIAALKKMINARSLDTYRATKEILANEIGVIYRKPGTKIPKSSEVSMDDTEAGIDPKLANTEGTVDGGVFRFKAGHYEWLLHMASHLGLEFNDMGKRRLGTKGTLFFCDELSRLYGSEDPNIAEGASFAVENWAAAGFWKELISGLEKFIENNQDYKKMPVAFFTFHDKLESQHATHVQDELAEVYFEDDFDKEKFINGGLEMLDGVKAFWDGLDEDRKKEH